MKIIFVTGPSFSGKSIYIKKEYPDAKVVKISTFREIVGAADDNEELEQMALNSYYYCEEALKNTIRAAGENDTVILEAQMLSKKERDFFLKAVREVSGAPVECVLLTPDEEKINELLADQPTLINLHKYEKSKIDEPSIEEGFSEVTYVFPEFEETDWSGLVKPNR